MQFFGTDIQCPRCLKRIRVNPNKSQDIACKECRFIIPFAYIRDYKNTPPVFVQLFGLPAAGKTTFLDMLRLHLLEMDQAWGDAGFYMRPITQLDMDHQTTLLTERSRGEIPGSTPKRDRNQNEVYITALMHMARWQSRFLVLMDHSGEFFRPLIIDVAEIPFLQHTPVAIILLSLPDLERDGKRVNDLVTSYITSLEAKGVKFTKVRRQLVIVFSKADLIADLPQELREYLNADTIYMSLSKRQQNLKLGDADMDNYILRMGEVSNFIRGWVETRIPGGAAMLHMLDDKGITTRFTVMSATGHTLSRSGNTLAPAPRRVLDPFFWVLEFYKHIGPRNVVQADVAAILSTFSPDLRTAGSIALLILLFFCTLGGSFYVFNLSHGSSGFVGFCLSLFLLLFCTLVNHNIGKNDPPTRSILTITRLALFLSCFAQFPSVPYAFPDITLYHLISSIIVIAAIFSLFLPSDRLALLSRVTLAAIAGIGALLQSTFGVLELQSLPFSLSHGSMPASDVYTLINSLLLCVLVGGAIIALFLSTNQLIWTDWVILFAIAPIYGLLQLAFGSLEIRDAFPLSTNPLLSWASINFFNAGLALMLGIALPLSLFILHRFSRLGRLPLLALAIACAFMLNSLGSEVKVPFLPSNSPGLAIKIVDLLTPTRFVEYGLVVVSVLLCIRLIFTSFPRTFTFIDHILLFIAAYVCVQLQAFSLRGPSQEGSLLVVLAVASQIVAIGLLFLILAGLGVASIMLLLPLARQSSQGERIIKAFSNHFAWINNLPLWIERMVVSGTGIGCALLIDFPTQGISSPSDLFKGGVAAVLAICAFIALCRWKRPFTRGDRFLVLINLLFCTFFFFAMNIPLIFLSLTGQIWNDNTFQPQIPAVFLFGITLLFIAFISFWWWTAHCQFSGNRRVLQIAFGVAFASGLLQLVVPSFLFTLLTLLALIMGMMIARISASSTP